MGKRDTGRRNALNPHQREKGRTAPREKEKVISREEKGKETENVGIVEKQDTGHMSAKIQQRKAKGKGMGMKIGSRDGSQMACARYAANRSKSKNR